MSSFLLELDLKKKACDCDPFSKQETDGQEKSSLLALWFKKAGGKCPEFNA